MIMIGARYQCLGIFRGLPRAAKDSTCCFFTLSGPAGRSSLPYAKTICTKERIKANKWLSGGFDLSGNYFIAPPKGRIASPQHC